MICKSKCWEFHLWHECVGYRCDDVQWRHPRSSVVRIYMKRKEEGRGLISVEDCITTERRGSYDYLKESKEDMLSGSLQKNVI